MTKYPVFTESMKETHTILVPDMLPIHFNLIISILRNAGYKLELLQTSTSTVIEEGLKKTSVTTVLIGDETASRRWVKYEIVKSFERGNGILGIHINRIRGRDQSISARGLNPLDRLAFQISEDGKKIRFMNL